MSDRKKAINLKLHLRKMPPAFLAPLIAGIFSAAANAQPAVDEAAFNRRVNESVNVITLFTSQRTFSSGLYTFDSDETSDVDFNVTQIPYTYYFEPTDGGLIPEVSFLYGFSKTTRSIYTSPEARATPDFSRVLTNSFALSAGVEVPIVSNFYAAPRFAVSYSHLKRRYDFNNSFSQTELKPFDRDGFNTSVDVMTYTPSLELGYRMNLEKTTVEIHSQYSQLYNNSFSSKSRTIDIDSDTGLLQTEIEARIPLGKEAWSRELQAHPFIVRSDIFSEARDALGFSYFHEVGIDLLLVKPGDSGLLGELSIGTSYTFGEDFRGYRIGFGFGI